MLTISNNPELTPPARFIQAGERSSIAPLGRTFFQYGVADSPSASEDSLGRSPLSNFRWHGHVAPLQRIGCLPIARNDHEGFNRVSIRYADAMLMNSKLETCLLHDALGHDFGRQHLPLPSLSTAAHFRTVNPILSFRRRTNPAQATTRPNTNPKFESIPSTGMVLLNGSYLTKQRIHYEENNADQCVANGREPDCDS